MIAKLPEGWVVQPTVLPAVGRKAPRPIFFVEALRPPVGDTIGYTTLDLVSFPSMVCTFRHGWKFKNFLMS